MRKAKQSALEAQGWTVGSVDDFLKRLHLSQSRVAKNGSWRSLSLSFCRPAAPVRVPRRRNEAVA